MAEVANADLPFNAGQWVRITLVWALSNTGAVAQIYFDGTAALLSLTKNGPLLTPVVGSGASLHIGASGPSDSNFANGVFDDFKSYQGVLVP